MEDDLVLIHFLLRPEMLQGMPEGIIVRDYGELSLVLAPVEAKRLSAVSPGLYRDGRHILVCARPSVLYAWLSKYSGVMIGLGAPILQDFEYRVPKEMLN